MQYNTKNTVLKKPVVWQNLYIYRKSDAIYQLTVAFCQRFLPEHGDRTVDQMVQAARSGKQNIVEGCEDGQTSSEMEIKLLNVARGSLRELREDYQDYLNTHHLSVWQGDGLRLERLRSFCHQHNDFADYELLVSKMNDEEFANLMLTLCHQTDKMMYSYIENLEKRFVSEGGIKERMHSARTGYRQQQDAYVRSLEEENKRLKQQIMELQERLSKGDIGEPRIS